ncbi:MAG: methyltransferase family protein [Cellvibrionales bacterium]|tara:strand:- start:3319 stop:3765 length:447 start_codon:yes stop_codon:yes gene_type:complete
MHNKIPPPIVTAISGLAIYLSRSLFPTYHHTVADIFSAAFFLLGIATLSAAVLSFKQQQTTVNPLQPEKASSLVISGIFKYSRNPMYIGMLLMLLSATLKFNVVGGIVVVLMFVLFITKFQILPEEAAMQKIFGQAFVDYKATTRRWV